MKTREQPCRQRRQHRQRGATIVEFTLTFMLFLVIILTLMELGRGMWAYSTIAHAARQMGRYCMLHGSENPTTVYEIKSVLEKYCQGLELDDLTVTIIWNPDAATPNTDPANVERGDIVQVRLSYPFRLVTGGLGLADNTIQMGTTTQMIVAN